VKTLRRLATIATTGMVAATAIAFSATSASASLVPITLSTAHAVGIYKLAESWSSKVAPDLKPYVGASVDADCYTYGENIAGQGSVWYHIWSYRTHSGDSDHDTWAYEYGKYVDNYNAMNWGWLPYCGY